MSDKKAVIKNADMPDEMQQDAVDCAMQAMEKYNIEKDIAAYVKKVTWINIKWVIQTFIETGWEWPLIFDILIVIVPPAGVWQEVQPHMALHCWEELWQLRDARDQAFHLLLPGPSGYTTVQVRLKFKHAPFENYF